MALFGHGMLFDHLSIDKSKINAVKQYKWKIDGNEYQKCKELGASEYVQSPQFTYHIEPDSVICFHFNFYARLNADDKEYCGIFVEIDDMPEDIKRINIEVDIKCNEKRAYRQLLRDQQLDQNKRMCGFRVFRTSELNKNICFEWTFGVKIFNMKTLEQGNEAMENNEEDIEFCDVYKTFTDLY